MSKQQMVLLNDLQKALIGFFDDLTEQFPKEPDFILIRIAIKDTISPLDIMNFFIQKILPEKELIMSHSDSFFLEKNTLFSMGNFNSNTFKKIWSNDLDAENKSVIWKWLECFIKIVEKYQKVE
jgi:hypothetical protein